MTEWLTRFGLTPADFDTRPLIVCGDVEGELRPPYENTLHQSRAGEILAYAQGFPRRVMLAGNRQVDLTQTFGDVSLIEVAGSYPDVCVRDAIAASTEKGVLVYVDYTKLLDADPNVSDTELGQLITKQGLSLNYRRTELTPTTSLYYTTIPITARRR